MVFVFSMSCLFKTCHCLFFMLLSNLFPYPCHFSTIRLEGLFLRYI